MKIFNINPLARSVGIFGVVAALATAVTFAALSSQATLSDNTVDSATADLNIWDGAAFSTTAPGFHVTGLVPGQGSGELPLYLQNAGDGNMNVTAHVPTLPGPPAGGYGFSGFDNLLVTITGDGPTCPGTSGNLVHTDLLALNSGDVPLPCNKLHAGATGNGGVLNTEGNYTVNFDINPAALTPGASSAGVGSFNIVLTGTQTP